MQNYDSLAFWRWANLLGMISHAIKRDPQNKMSTRKTTTATKVTSSTPQPRDARLLTFRLGILGVQRHGRGGRRWRRRKTRRERERGWEPHTRWSNRRRGGDHRLVVGRVYPTGCYQWGPWGRHKPMLMPQMTGMTSCRVWEKGRGYAEVVVGVPWSDRTTQSTSISGGRRTQIFYWSKSSNTTLYKVPQKYISE